MFKKKLLSITLAASLMTAMLPTGVMASETTPEWNTNGGEQTVTGTSTVVEPLIQVELPGDLTFGINPLYLDADGDDKTTEGQIISGQYPIINYSNVDVLVTAETTVAKATDAKVTFLTDVTVDGISGELIAGSDTKNIFLAQMLPTAQATIGTDESITLTTGKVNIASDKDDTEKKIAGYALSGVEGEKATVLFKLAKYNDKLLPACVSGFAFDGAVDPNAVFVEGDITVKTVFTLNTLTGGQYTGSYQTLDKNEAGTAVTFDSTIVKLKTTS